MEEHHEFGQWSGSSEDMFMSQMPLHRACRDGDIETLANILAAGEVNFYEEDDFYGWTPIHWAAYNGKLTCMMRLLENGASHENTTERLNQSPAHIAACGGRSHCLKILLECGALINRQLACVRKLTTLCSDSQVMCELPTSRFKKTALHLACYMGHPYCVQWMVHTGANFEMKDYLGETPVHKAARTGNMECASLLVSQGCKLSIRNYNGQSPSQLAAACGFHECANYLEQASQLQEQGIAITDGLRKPASHQCLIASNSHHCQPSTDTCVVIQGTNNGLIQNSNHTDLNTPVGVEHGMSYFDDNECDMDAEEMEGAVGGIGNDDMQGLEVSISRSGTKRCLDDKIGECTKKMKTTDKLWNKNNLSGQMNGHSPDTMTLDIQSHSYEPSNHRIHTAPQKKHVNQEAILTHAGPPTLHKPLPVFTTKVCDLPPKCMALQSHFI